MMRMAARNRGTKQRDSSKEVMVEGIEKREKKKFSREEINFIIQKRIELCTAGLDDSKIAVEIAKCIERTTGSVATMIYRLVKTGRLSGNSNNKIIKDFSNGEIEHIKRKWPGLILKGFRTEQIAKKFGAELGRTTQSMRAKLKKMIMSGELQDNPNKKEEYADKDLQLIICRRNELILEGYTDNGIVNILAQEMRKTFGSIFCLIRRLVREKKLFENPKKQYRKKLTNEESQFITRKRDELISEGLNDGQITRKISCEIKKGKKQIADFIYHSVSAKKIPANPNKQPKFTKQEIEYIVCRRNELIIEGLNDSEISTKIAEKMDRTACSIATMVSRLVKKKILEKNPNNKSKFSHEDVQYIIRRRIELEAEGKNDTNISKIISDEKSWIECSVNSKIRQFIKEGKLQENPNKRITRIRTRKPDTENWQLSGLSQAALAMEKFGEGENE